MKPLSHEEVKKYINSFGYSLLNEYVNSTTPIIVQCEKGHEPYSVKWGNFKTGKRCPHCKAEKLSEHFRETKEEILQTLKNSELELVDGIDDYKNNQSKLTVKCKHGHIYKTTYTVIKQGYGCRECYGTKKLTIDFIREEMKKMIMNY